MITVTQDDGVVRTVEQNPYGYGVVNYTIEPTDDPDVVHVYDDFCHRRSYRVIQKGHLWWKKFFIGLFSDLDNDWRKMSCEFTDREAAQEAMYVGEFRKV